jgi:hypothetical protein
MATVLPFPARLRAVPPPPHPAPPLPASAVPAPVGNADAIAAELLLEIEELTDAQRMAVACALVARVAAETAIGHRHPPGDARLTVIHRMSSTAERAAELAEQHARPTWPDGAA